MTASAVRPKGGMILEGLLYQLSDGSLSLRHHFNRGPLNGGFLHFESSNIGKLPLELWDAGSFICRCWIPLFELRFEFAMFSFFGSDLGVRDISTASAKLSLPKDVDGAT